SMPLSPPRSTLFPYTTLFRSQLLHERSRGWRNRYIQGASALEQGWRPHHVPGRDGSGHRADSLFRSSEQWRQFQADSLRRKPELILRLDQAFNVTPSFCACLRNCGAYRKQGESVRSPVWEEYSCTANICWLFLPPSWLRPALPLLRKPSSLAW